MDFPSDIDALPQMLGFIRDFLVKKGINKQKQRDVELACEEAVVNIIMYGRAATCPISIECEGEKESFSVVIRDEGVAFNPIDMEIDPKVDRPIHERQIGGLGLYLMRRLASEISYMRKDDQNVLKITFKELTSHL